MLQNAIIQSLLILSLGVFLFLPVLGIYSFLIGGIFIGIPFLFYRPFIIYFWAKRSSLKYSFRRNFNPEWNIVEGVYQNKKIRIYDSTANTIFIGSQGSDFIEKIRILIGIQKFVRKSPFITYIEIGDKKKSLRSSQTILGFFKFPNWHKEVVPTIEKTVSEIE